MNKNKPWDGLFELATVKDVVEAFSPALISIENDDSRECPPVDWDTFKRLFRGTDILRAGCRKIVVDDEKNHFKIWLV